MAYKRTSFKNLVNSKKEYFESSYKFSTKAKFQVGSDAYIIPLGLETGYYETPCHKLNTHKVNGQTIGFNGSSFATYIKCNGIDENGNRSESLCCTLAKMEKDRLPEKDDSASRLISFCTSKIHIPVLILGNTLADDSKISFPISKVSITKDLGTEKGLNFAFLDFAASTFNEKIITAYGKKLKDDGVLEYDMDEESEEFLEEVRTRLSKTIIRVHGITKQGFNAAMREYSFFPFDNKAIASGSGEGEREAIINYTSNNAIMEQINEFLTLFDKEVDGLIRSWTEKDLLEYYNSAMGLPLDTPLANISAEVTKKASKAPTEEETVEIVGSEATSKPLEDTYKAPEASDDDVDNFMKGLSNEESLVSDKALNDFDLDTEEEDFLEDETFEE